MRVWIDLANSPHVPLMTPVVERLREDGHETLLTARDHAQTVELAREQWPDVVVVGGQSPGGIIRKGLAIGLRASALRRFARRARPDIAFSHGSYAQLVAARSFGLPTVTMMDYEFQPANHISFRLAQKVIVPEAFPQAALRRFGVNSEKAFRYPGFKEELYLAGFEPDPSVPEQIGLDRGKVVAVFRPPPTGALYHRAGNERFDRLVEFGQRHPGVQVVLLPRSPDQARRYGGLDGVLVPRRAIDARSLLAYADLAIGAGGTMTRESALLGTPTYTVFEGRQAAVDAELVRRGLLCDLRDPEVSLSFERRQRTNAQIPPERRELIIAPVLDALTAVVRRRRGRSPRALPWIL
jgi:predicted glycosyltransferase